jgi:hypothetical protein
MKNTGLTVAAQATPVLESDGDVFRPLRLIMEKYQQRAAYLKNFTAVRRLMPKNRKVIPALESPARFYNDAALAVNVLIQQ